MKKEKNVHDLDIIMISPMVYQSWMRQLSKAQGKIYETAQLKKISISLEDIPDEQFREYEDGNGEIFIYIKKIDLKIFIEVPSGQWCFIKPEAQA